MVRARVKVMITVRVIMKVRVKVTVKVRVKVRIKFCLTDELCLMLLPDHHSYAEPYASLLYMHHHHSYICITITPMQSPCTTLPQVRVATHTRTTNMTWGCDSHPPVTLTVAMPVTKSNLNPNLEAVVNALSRPASPGVSPGVCTHPWVHDRPE